ncbi:uncharacterized protein YciI [Rhodoblastus acidophilus]|uniref:YciI family protein n=1 Tax=Rhodoblastus acidophilus TaxID=1074 RepID=UPI002225A830|nr:YciI family protein [Rhodoblastus acidophilus]MCW2285857.1 uncharacterized protein YciI [Rhodoblastus acidophilus]MCW2334751.1 uncharacterized protein YciI [Rhodoblastus acidophilus]
MHYVALCLDKPESLSVRTENRAAHLAFLAAHAPKVKLGGPFLDAAGQMCGSMLVLDCADEAEARAMLAQDPYAQAGLFASVELRAYKPVVGTYVA